MSNCISRAIGGGGSTPSRIASSVASPERWSPPAAVSIGSSQLTVRVRSGAAATAGSALIVVRLRDAGEPASGGGEHSLDPRGGDRLAAGAADPLGVHVVLFVFTRGVPQENRWLLGQPAVAPLHQALEHRQEVASGGGEVVPRPRRA